ncbi:MAG: methyltransferase domain-containing protein [Gemmatimonadaceae bacterium]|nr:methyltransferase domain-containing protein [Gemmatimonadaceae bacterium]
MTSPSPIATPADVSRAHAAEVEAGERFEFGKNWRAFLAEMDDASIRTAVESLRAMLGVTTLEGRSFLDIGSGSGLFSLAAHRLGATVTSFDYDPDSVGCTTELRRRYAADSDRWRVMQGSVLDAEFMAGLGQFDVVYSWGVLHHTGQMWPAIWNAEGRVAPGGLFFIAIYNDQGAWSARWVRIKRLYCSGPMGKALVSWSFIPFWIARDFAKDMVWGRNPLARYRQYGDGSRGMRVIRDYHDWLGGYPFEYATPEGIILPLQARGHALVNLKTARGTVGCVEYVFRKDRS